MKILIIVPGFPTNTEEIKGGVHSALSNLLRGFLFADIEVRVLSFNREIINPLVVNYSPNIEIHYTPLGNIPHMVYYLLPGSTELRKHVKEYNPSLVHYFMSGNILLTKFFSLFYKIHLVTIHGIAFPEARQHEKLKEKLVLYSHGLVEALFCPDNVIHLSEYSKALHRNKIKKTSAIIPNAVNPSYFDIPIKKGTDNKILYVGIIDPNKNIIFLLQTLKKLVEKKMNYTVDVLGGFLNETYKETVFTFIKNNNLEKHITFYGWVTQQKVQEVLAQSDILMVSSRQESLPMVIAEAKSAGKVVIASNVGGIPEMITHGEDGYVFNISSVENVLPFFEELYNNESRVHQIQLKAKQKAMETYHGKMVAQNTIAFYQQILQ